MIWMWMMWSINITFLVGCAFLLAQQSSQTQLWRPGTGPGSTGDTRISAAEYQQSFRERAGKLRSGVDRAGVVGPSSLLADTRPDSQRPQPLITGSEPTGIKYVLPLHAAINHAMGPAVIRSRPGSHPNPNPHTRCGLLCRHIHIVGERHSGTNNLHLVLKSCLRPGSVKLHTGFITGEVPTA